MSKNQNNSNIDEQIVNATTDTAKKVGGKAKDAAKNATRRATRKLVKKVAVQATKAVAKVAMKAFSSLIALLIKFAIPILIIIFVLFILYQVIFNFSSAGGSYTNEHRGNPNKIERTMDKETGIGYDKSIELKGSNSAISQFFDKLGQRGYWIVNPEDDKWDIKEQKLPELLNSTETDVQDFYRREEQMGVSGDLLFSLNKYVYGDRFVYPEHFIQGLPFEIEEDKEGLREYVIKPKKITGKNEELIIKSRKYLPEKKKFENEPTVISTHDYGIATIYQYKKDKLERYVEGVYTSEDYYDSSCNCVMNRPINEPFKDVMPGYPEDIWLIDKGNTFDGLYHFEYDIEEEIIGGMEDTVGPTNSQSKKIENGSVDIYEDNYVDTGRKDEDGNPITENRPIFKGTFPLYKYREGDLIEKKPVPNGPPKTDLIKEYEEKIAKAEEAEDKEKVETLKSNLEKARSINMRDYLYSYSRYFTALVPEIVDNKFNLEARAAALGLSMGFDINLDTGSGLNKPAFKKASQYLDTVIPHANEFGVDPNLIIAIMALESAGNPNQSGGGLMQVSWNLSQPISIQAVNTSGIMISHTIGGGAARNDVNDNIRYATMKIANKLKEYNNNPIKAIQAYNFDVSGYMKKNHPEKWADDTNNSWLNHREEARKHYASKEKNWTNSRSNTYSCVPHLDPQDNSLPVYGNACYVEMVLQYYDNSDGTINESDNKESNNENEESNNNDENDVGIEVDDGLQGNQKEQTNKFIAGVAKIFGFSSKVENKEEEFERFTFNSHLQPDRVDELLKVSQSYKDNTPFDITKDFDFEKAFSSSDPTLQQGLEASVNDGTKGSGGTSLFPFAGGTLSIQERMALQAYGIEKPHRSGYVSSSYGTRWGRLHQGMDVAASVGTPLYAVSDLKVKSFLGSCPSTGWFGSRGTKNCFTSSGSLMGLGNHITLEFPNGYYVVYAHLNKLAPGISVGKEIKKGEIIGYLGNSGHSSGPHLHFELRKPNGHSVNPSFIVNGY